MLNKQYIKIKQVFIIGVKISIVGIAFYFIYQRLYNNPELSFFDFSSFLVKNGFFSLKNGLFLLFLTILNWCFEILKWKSLVNSITPISFFEALKQTLAAHTTAIFTPNRIGDYGVKVMYYQIHLRTRVLLLNLIGNLVQMGMTLSFGIIGLFLFISTYSINISNQYILAGCTIVILIIGLLTVLYKWKNVEIKGVSIVKSIVFTKTISITIHLKNGLFSLIRYLIFSFQYYYLLILFGVHIDYTTAMIVISSMYLLSSIIPTLFVFDAVVKGSIAIYLFNFLNINEFIVLCVTMCMWLLNFALPTLFGSIFILNFKSSYSITQALNTEH